MISLPEARRCGTCGAENSPSAKFCSTCGRSLSGEPGSPIQIAEARKVITAVFADLVGSTELTERLDPEEAREVVGRFYAIVQQAVERFEGTVANLLGDAVLAVFGLPVTHEDDPERAVRAGLAMREAMAGLNERLAADYGVDLAIRVGINTGEVVAASGSTFDRDFLISDAVTTAARLQQAGTPGSVIIGERTYRLAGDTFLCRVLPPVEAKGKAVPLAAWEVERPLAERRETRAIAAPLVGRQGDIGLLRQLYTRAHHQASPHLVTLLGEPGVGKSRLLREFLAAVGTDDPPPLVLRGRSIAFGGQIGYHALRDVLRAQTGAMATDPAPLVREKLAAWLRDALPAQDGLLDDLTLTFESGDETRGDPADKRRRLFAAWKALLTGLAAGRPLVAAFEDIHWADDGLLDLIQNLTAGLKIGAMFVVCVGRPDLLQRRPHWGLGWRNASIITLGPLPADEAEALVEALAGEVLAAPMRRAVVQRAEGNPLFAEELVRMLVEGHTAPSAIAIPDTIQAVVVARIDRLPADERLVLQAAAVIGRTFWPSAVAQLSGLSGDAVARALGRLEDLELIVARSQSAIAGEPEYAFRFILERDVAYNLLPRSQRQRAHAEAARWLEARLGEHGADVVEILAEHMRLSGEDARAVDYLRRAADKARQLYANAEALRLYTHALDAAQRATLPEDRTLDLLRGRGEVRQLRGEYPAALADFEAGLTAARRHGHHGLEAVFENRVGAIHHRQARLDEAQEHFTRAAALARGIGDRHTLAVTLIDLATVAWDLGALPPDDPALTEGIGLLRETGDRSGLARALNLLCMAHYAVGDPGLAIPVAEEALITARAAGDRSREATSLSYLSVIHTWVGRPRESLRYANEARAVAEAIGDRRRVAYAVIFIAQVCRDIGDWGYGIRLMEEHLELGRELIPAEIPLACWTLAEMYDEVGDARRAEAMLRAAQAFNYESPWRQKVSVMVDLALARLTRDRMVLSRVLDGLPSLAVTTFLPVDLAVLLPVGEAIAETGHIEMLGGLIEAYRGPVERFGSPVFLAALAILEARLASLETRDQEVPALLDRAVELSRAAENVFLLRRILEWRIQLLNRDDDHAALRALHRQIADWLPEDLRATFLASPRVLEAEAAPRSL